MGSWQEWHVQYQYNIVSTNTVAVKNASSKVFLLWSTEDYGTGPSNIDMRVFMKDNLSMLPIFLIEDVLILLLVIEDFW